MITKDNKVRKFCRGHQTPYHNLDQAKSKAVQQRDFLLEREIENEYANYGFPSLVATLFIPNKQNATLANDLLCRISCFLDNKTLARFAQTNRQLRDLFLSELHGLLQNYLPSTAWQNIRICELLAVDRSRASKIFLCLHSGYSGLTERGSINPIAFLMATEEDIRNSLDFDKKMKDQLDALVSARVNSSAASALPQAAVPTPEVDAADVRERAVSQQPLPLGDPQGLEDVGAGIYVRGPASAPSFSPRRVLAQPSSSNPLPITSSLLQGDYNAAPSTSRRQACSLTFSGTPQKRQRLDMPREISSEMDEDPDQSTMSPSANAERFANDVWN